MNSSKDNTNSILVELSKAGLAQVSGGCSQCGGRHAMAFASASTTTVPVDLIGAQNDLNKWLEDTLNTKFKFD